MAMNIFDEICRSKYLISNPSIGTLPPIINIKVMQYLDSWILIFTATYLKL